MPRQVIGFRVESDKAVHYAVVREASPAIVLVDRAKFRLPKGEVLSVQLATLRTQLLTAFEAHRPSAVLVRTAEPASRSSVSTAAKRGHVEGVVLEAAGSMRIPTTHGANVTIKSKMGTTTSLREYTEGEEEVRGISLEGIPKGAARESVVAAVAALEVK